MATHKLLKCVQKRRYQSVGYFVAIGDRQSLFQFRLYLLVNLRQVSSLTSAFVFLGICPYPFFPGLAETPLLVHPALPSSASWSREALSGQGTVSAASAVADTAAACVLLLSLEVRASSFL